MIRFARFPATRRRQIPRWDVWFHSYPEKTLRCWRCLSQKVAAKPTFETRFFGMCRCNYRHQTSARRQRIAIRTGCGACLWSCVSKEIIEVGGAWVTRSPKQASYITFRDRFDGPLRRCSLEQFAGVIDREFAYCGIELF